MAVSWAVPDPKHTGWARVVVSEVTLGMPLLCGTRSSNADNEQSAWHGPRRPRYRGPNPPAPNPGCGALGPAGDTGGHMLPRLTPGNYGRRGQFVVGMPITGGFAGVPFH